MSGPGLPGETSSFFLYSGKDGKVLIECRVVGETIWLTQKQLSGLCEVGVPAINKHLKNIFETGELLEEATVSKMEIVRARFPDFRSFRDFRGWFLRFKRGIFQHRFPRGIGRISRISPKTRSAPTGLSLILFRFGL